MDKVLSIPEIFGCDVFNEATMKERLPEEIFAAWKFCVTNGSQLPLDVANEIAEAMKLKKNKKRRKSMKKQAIRIKI